MKLNQALKKSNVVRRASDPDETYEVEGGFVKDHNGELTSFSLADVNADDWQFKVVTEKWVGSREKKEAVKK